jgi:hypothetical protein
MYVSSHNICSNNRESEEMFEDRKGYLLVAHRSRTYIARNSLPFMSAWDHRWFIVGSVLIIFLVFCVPVLFVCFRPVSCIPLDCPFVGFL